MAAAGINKKIGENNKAAINIRAVTTEVKPVLPPAATPQCFLRNLLRLKFRAAPTTVPIASDKRPA